MFILGNYSQGDGQKFFLNCKVKRSNYFWSLFLEPLIVILKKNSKSYQSLKKWFNRLLSSLISASPLLVAMSFMAVSTINGSHCGLHGSLGGSLGGSNCRSSFFEVFSSLLSWITWCYRIASQHPPRHTSRGRR